ncbi:unnamed protein product [Nesidiocoris tenuis]|uniref:Uncharacterized protein n=1 Tax=Nesidiocoris tenuis TaxID=355587 RepID=A0A6H5GR67_9HEMI|nr:unnamed protein product [Nesidiocoris tenuis]
MDYDTSQNRILLHVHENRRLTLTILMRVRPESKWVQLLVFRDDASGFHVNFGTGFQYTASPQ